MELPHASSLTFREMTPEEKVQCWRNNSVSWAGKLLIDDYIARETLNGTGPIAARNGMRYWGLVGPAMEKSQHDSLQQDVEIYAAVECLRKTILVNDRDGEVREEHGWALISVFTPENYRGKGYGRAVVNGLAQWLDHDQSHCPMSLLYSDVGDYYSSSGWKKFPSPETYLPSLVSPSSPGSFLPTMPLTSEQIERLCSEDVSALRHHLRTTSLPPSIRLRLACVPSYAQACFHFGSTDLTAKVLGKGDTSIKGAMAPSGQTFIYWAQDFAEDKLSILRIVSKLNGATVGMGVGVQPTRSPGDDTSQTTETAPQLDEQVVQELASVLHAAQLEAGRWGFAKAVLWAPDAHVVQACQACLDGTGTTPPSSFLPRGPVVDVYTRTDGSVPCVRMRPGAGAGAPAYADQPGWEAEVQWVANEKYAWC